jgi:surfeit locus 1 family protein
MKFRKPEFGPALFAFCVVALMFSLGTWQLYRLQWKNALIASIEKAQSEAPEDFSAYSANLLPGKEWHNIRITGYFLNDKELYATPRYYREQMGYAILTPLAVATHSGLQYILINRGWVPPAQKDPKTRAEGNSTKIVTVEGVIRNPLPQGTFTPDNNPAKNIWFWYDIPAMAKSTKLPLMPVFIDATQVRFADGAALQGGPTPFPLEIKIRNDHLGYAITWFLIGIAGIVMFGIYYSEKKSDKRTR